MFRRLSSDTITKSFISYLESGFLSRKSVKNYRSDVSHFSAWLILKIKTLGVSAQNLSEAIPFLNESMGKEYRDYLSENGFPIKTVNRRLSTLRHLARFLLESQILSFDFMNGLQNIIISKDIKIYPSFLISDFKKKLEEDNVSKNTIKNYISDVNQFFSWLDSKKQVPSN